MTPAQPRDLAKQTEVAYDVSERRTCSIFCLPRSTIRCQSVADGTLDFHSLRVTFVTSLARSGVHPKVAQMLARHSTIEITMGTYTKLDDDELRAGVEALPPLPTKPMVAGA